MKEIKHVVQFSGGKDSTCMLLMMLEKGMPVDDIIFCDTGMEFPALYEHIDEVEKYIGRKITRLKAEHSYEYMMHCNKRKRGNHTDVIGYGWPTMQIRWCTKYFKIGLFQKYFKHKNCIIYIGIAADEPQRHKNIASNVRHPLFEWGITEAQALSFCYAHKFYGGVFMKILSVFRAGVVLFKALMNCESYITNTLICGNA